jgi:hypothetical protein
MKKIRTLKADEIECRPQSVKNNKATLLLYIDSRAATNLLDETYGMENWTIEYKDVAGQIYGRLSIYDTETNRWIYREDTGSPANIEKEKSLASDILKRTIVRFGVTELYTTPRVEIPDDGYGNSGYKVSEIEYSENREIIHLVITNRFGKEMYRWDINKPSTPVTTTSTPVEEKKDTPVVSKKDTLILFCKENKTEENKDSITAFYKFYLNKIDNWTGTFDVKKLYTLWEQKRNGKTS